MTKNNGKLSRGRIKIIEIHNAKIHGLVDYVHSISNVPYQQVFDIFCQMLCEGYVLGKDSYQALLERVLKQRAGIERPQW